MARVLVRLSFATPLRTADVELCGRRENLGEADSFGMSVDQTRNALLAVSATMKTLGTIEGASARASGIDTRKDRRSWSSGSVSVHFARITLGTGVAAMETGAVVVGAGAGTVGSNARRWWLRGSRLALVAVAKLVYPSICAECLGSGSFEFGMIDNGQRGRRRCKLRSGWREDWRTTRVVIRMFISIVNVCKHFSLITPLITNVHQ